MLLVWLEAGILTISMSDDIDLAACNRSAKAEAHGGFVATPFSDPALVKVTREGVLGRHDDCLQKLQW